MAAALYRSNVEMVLFLIDSAGGDSENSDYIDGLQTAADLIKAAWRMACALSALDPDPDAAIAKLLAMGDGDDGLD